jgi:hypothetical protein
MTHLFAWTMSYVQSRTIRFLTETIEVITLAYIALHSLILQKEPAEWRVNRLLPKPNC